MSAQTWTPPVEDWHAIRTRREYALLVYCPSCHAGPHERCRDGAYRARESCHDARHTRAVALGAPRGDSWKHSAGDGPLRARTARSDA